MTVQQAYQRLTIQLNIIYDRREAAAIASLVVEHVTGFANSSRIMHKDMILSNAQAVLFNECAAQLAVHKPLQYVLHEAPFYGMNFYVDESVLIPRPETEELVEWIINEINIRYSIINDQYSMLDVGTGSGCIPVVVKTKLPLLTVHAVDISANALQVAAKNAAQQNTVIIFHELDILDKDCWQQLPQFDIIVSNPPYIAQREATDMHNHVLQYEPHLALFVPDKQPLLFYEKITLFGLQHLKEGGRLYFEINEVYGKEINELLAANGYTNIELRKDMQGKDRMIRAQLP